ncbi:MAG: VPLPA-CTERM sorting domain-containing protein, partial [Gammaproteobacteria bacterium]
MKHIFRSILLVVFYGSSISAQAALIGRLPSSPGGTDYQAAYDDVLDITWLTNAGLSTRTNWDDQKAWAQSLNNDNYLGFDSWRLATTNRRSFAIENCRDVSEQVCQNNNELGYMFWYNLDGELGENKTGDQMVGDVLLSDIQDTYWSNTDVTGPGVQAFAYSFSFQNSAQSITSKTGGRDGWAVIDGDIGETMVPIPAALPLLLSGITGLLVMRRRRTDA